MIYIKFYNIQWDSGGVDLPQEVYLKTTEKGIDLNFEGANILSDLYGFCVFSFDFKILKEE